MTRRTILPPLSVLLTLTIVPLAQAHWLTGVGRHLGMGWSDGYHAQNDCPPKHAGRHCPNCPPEAAWWMQPALPHGPPHAGPSLFRQPGEGSSVIIGEQVQ